MSPDRHRSLYNKRHITQQLIVNQSLQVAQQGGGGQGVGGRLEPVPTIVHIRIHTHIRIHKY